MSEKFMPVLVGVGQVTEKEVTLEGSSVLDLIEQAVYQAADDAGISKKQLADLDTLAIVRSFRESTRNTPESIANRIGASRARQWLMPNGGNGPQYLVNRFSEAIANGECQFALFAGAEAMATSRKIVKETGEQPAWSEPASGDPEYLVSEAEMTTQHEQQYGILTPSWVYAMHENALRHQLGRSVDDHQRELGRLFSKFTDVAAQSPHAWYPISRSAEEIAYPSDSNRMVSWPYTKYMNAMNQINQSAALLLTSVDYARKLGISEDKFVYLHGCSDTKEKMVYARPTYHQSDAMRVMAERVFEGNLSIDDMKYIDFYSCFPVAVEFACQAFGVSTDDPRALTITGGLPFHGGAGNNYVMNSIAAMVDEVRADRGSYGLVTANGGYFSKHAAGVYSTNPVEGEWRRTHPSKYQGEIDNLPDAPFTEAPEGEASVETYTVVYGRDNAPGQGFVIGRLGEADDPNATRFLSVAAANPDELKAMTEADMVGAKGSVTQVEGVNTFKLA
ncbi:MAG: acetyl-CoA acetyltransferase [Pseudomonadales bacterium]|nr:acetyl-CoA acetyltransferase [Pseudomonadales bacterium]MBO7004527.1 acetyl-CoA acetyltransferase [Pseudomonadales bacterium]